MKPRKYREKAEQLGKLCARFAAMDRKVDLDMVVDSIEKELRTARKDAMIDCADLCFRQGKAWACTEGQEARVRQKEAFRLDDILVQTIQMEFKYD